MDAALAIDRPWTARYALPLRKLVAIFRIYLRECLAYPAASMLWVLADAQTAMILPADALTTDS